MQTLSLDQVRYDAPAAFSAVRGPKCSEKFHAYKTMDVIQPVLDQGWEIVQAGQASDRDGKHNRFAGQHLLRISREDLVVDNDGDPYRIDAVICNSNSGDKSFSVELGVYRFLCANGNVTADEFDRVLLRHVYPQEKVVKACELIVANAPKIAQHISDWKKFELRPDQAVALATVGAGIRWGNTPLVDPATLVRTRRYEDQGSDLWHVFQVIQENLVRGGQEYTKNDKVRKIRQVKSLNGNLHLNRGLWHAAENLRKGLALAS